MKKIIVLLAFVFSTGVCSNVYAQGAPPPGAGDKDLRDTNVKGRSNELERIDRESRTDATRKNNKSVPNSTPEEDKLAAKYGEIKTDFEQIQMAQDSIIKTYQGGGKIDYAQISKFSLEINKSAARLNANLFPQPSVETPDAGKVENKDAKNGEKTEKEAKKSKSVRDLIVDLDNTIGSFATSTMFQNLRVVDPAVSEKTKADLEKIIELSAILNTEAQKTAVSEK